MSDKPKSAKTTKPKVPSIASGSSRTRVPASAVKERPANAFTRPTTRPKCAKFNPNATVIGETDAVAVKQHSSSFMPDFDAESRQLAYGRFLRTMLEEILVDEKVEREETQIDIQMAQLADRFQKTMDVLDKTDRRMKDVSFVVEQKRLLDLKSSDSSRFYEMTDASNVQELLHNLNATEQACLDKLETKNIDFGFDKNSGHKQLLDAITEAVEGLKQIKTHSNLDTQKFEEYKKSQRSLEDLETDRVHLDALKTDFERKFPMFSEKLLREASEKIAKTFDNEDVDD